MHLQKENAHIYPLRALKLLFNSINYPPDRQPCKNTENTSNYPNIAVTIFAAVLRSGYYSNMLKSC